MVFWSSLVSTVFALSNAMVIIIIIIIIIILVKSESDRASKETTP